MTNGYDLLGMRDPFVKIQEALSRAAIGLGGWFGLYGVASALGAGQSGGAGLSGRTYDGSFGSVEQWARDYGVRAGSERELLEKFTLWQQEQQGMGALMGGAGVGSGRMHPLAYGLAFVR